MSEAVQDPMSAPESVWLAETPLASQPAPCAVWRGGQPVAGQREVAEEAYVALVYNGSTEAVMMATPADLEDFALGFSLTEGLIKTGKDLKRISIHTRALGIDIQMWVATERAEALATRRHLRTGPTGCGLCGVESLEAANRPVQRVGEGVTISSYDIHAAVRAVEQRQWLNGRTRAVHAAGFWAPQSLPVVREDVGRHNALDKLAGALVSANIAAGQGIVVLTSRISVEMVQKAVVMGVSIVVAVSAPTALSIRTARDCGLTLIGVARGDGFEVFTHPHRVTA